MLGLPQAQHGVTWVNPAPVSEILTITVLFANHTLFLSQVTLLSFAVESESTFLDYIKGG